MVESDSSQSHQSPGRSPNSSKRIRIAFVDPDQSWLSEVQKWPKPWASQAELEVYTSASEALKALSETQPDVVFIEVRMPKISGIECVRSLKAVLPDLRIIILTGIKQSHSVVRALTAGVDGFMVKPVGPAECWEAIQEVMSGYPILNKEALRLLFSSYRRRKEQWRSEKGLTFREHEIMSCLIQGYRDKEIAKTLKMGTGTVHTHMSRMFKKLSVTRRSDAVKQYLNTSAQ